MSIHPLRPTADTAAECFTAVENATRGQPYPFGNRPLIVIRTNNDLRAYERLQARLLLLSRNSKQITAENSSHMVIIDEPEVITSNVQKMVNAVREQLNQSK
jgi:hypothetical protein